MKSPTVSKTGALPPGLDFQELFKAGLLRAQQVSGAVWTDFNLHDPGVTILEHLSYALTDVVYRAGHPIEDLLNTPLAAEDDPVIDPGRGHPVPQNFPTADQILTISPITRADWQLAACDADPDIRCAWITPVPESEDGRTPPGLFDVELMLFTSPDDPTATFLNKPDKAEKVRKHLRAARALGEDVNSVDVVDTHPVQIVADIEPDDGMDGTVDGTELVIRILEHVSMSINPPIAFQNTEALIEKGVPLDRVFDGPKLNRGTSLEPPASAKQETITAELVRALVMQVEGVKRIRHLHLGRDGRPDGAVEVIDTRKSAYGLISIWKDGATVVGGLQQTELGPQTAPAPQSGPARTGGRRSLPADATPETDKHIHFSLNHRQEKIRQAAEMAPRKQTSLAMLAPPPGKTRTEIGAYRSIQHGFPAIYGLSDAGASKIVGGQTPSADHVAQLKGFLMIFEQQIANLLSQMAHMPKLLSAKSDASHSYFSGDLLSETRVRGAGKDSASGTADLLSRTGASPGNKVDPGVKAEYVAALGEIAETPNEKNDRIEKALAHLAARFNETFPDPLAVSQSSVPHADWLDECAKRIARKRAFVNEYAQLSQHRAVANPLKFENDSPAVTALTERLRRLAGLSEAPRIIEHIMLRYSFDPKLFIMSVPVALSVGLNGKNYTMIGPQALDLTQADHAKTLSEYAKDIRTLRFFGTQTCDVRLFLADKDGEILLEVLQPFTSQKAARAAGIAVTRALSSIFADQDPATTVTPVFRLPERFLVRRLSVIFAECDLRADQRLSVEALLQQGLPAHMSADAYWDLEQSQRADIAEFERALADRVSEADLADTGGRVANHLSQSFRSKRVAAWRNLV